MSEDGGTVLGPGGPRLLTEQCVTCIFRPGNPMHLNRGRVKAMVTDTLDGGGFITCHKTLPYGDHPDFGPAICRGFFDRYAQRSNVLRAWERLGGFVEVAPPTEED